MDLTPEERRRIGGLMLEFLNRFYDRVADLDAVGAVLDPETSALLARPPSEEGRSSEELLEVIELANASGILHPSGGHLSYIPNAGSYTGALAALLGAGLGRFTGVPGAAPGMVQIESSVIKWLSELFEFPEDAAGILLSGGSMANFTALTAARSARLPEDFLSGSIYLTRHAHHSLEKAARLAGFPRDRLRFVPTDRSLRMEPASLTAMIEEDRRDGLQPFMVVGSAGTTDTGAVDPLADLGTVAAEQGLWFHVDAAYGGFFQLTERGRKRLVGISSADSVTLDPHKGLSVPFGVGGLIVRDRRYLVEANAGKGNYLRDHLVSGELPDFSVLGPELTRPFRGLEVWLPLQLHGVAAFRVALDNVLDLAEYAYGRLEGIDGVETPWRPELSIVAFQLADNEIADRAVAAVNADGKVHISSTLVEGRVTLRLALLNRRTTREHVDLAIDAVERVVG